jgi:hypothetical protein
MGVAMAMTLDRGARTVDVTVRRLRTRLSDEHVRRILAPSDPSINDLVSPAGVR